MDLRRFANAQGGVLYIGRRDDGSVCGVADSKKLMEDIRHKRTEKEMKFADIIYEDVVGYFIEKKGVLYFKGGCGDYMISDTTVEIMKENYELYTSIL